jgi:hypothetical protein
MATKLGPHVLRAAPDLLEFIHAGAAVVKFVGDWGMAGDVPDGTLVVGRQHQASFDAQLQRESGKSPAEAARQFFDTQRARYLSNPLIQYWEGHNEPVWSTVDGMAWYAQFEIERMRLMAGLGLRCVIGNFATGTPPLELWPAFLPALQAAVEYRALLGLHEYSCPWMWWMTGSHQIDPAADQGDEGWTTLRYRKVYRQHLIPHHLGSLPLVITECGIDPLVTPRPEGAPAGAWKDLGKYWEAHDGEADKADYYFRQLVWYDEELQKDHYVVGATIFTWGNFGGAWADFDVAGTGVSQRLITYAQENPTSRPFRYPLFELPSGLPRVQYERTYVLLPPHADANWARAVVSGSWEDRKFTIGGSADDAGIGDLDVRRVIAVNPDRWPSGQTLQAFFARYYPGVEYYPLQVASPEELRIRLESL